MDPKQYETLATSWELLIDNLGLLASEGVKRP
jgi:hypothetical protein